MKKRIIFSVLFFSILSFCINAQEIKDSAKKEEKFSPTLDLKGYSQLNYAYGFNENMADFNNDPMGFSLRYMRLYPTGYLSKNVNWGLLFGFDKMSPGIISAFLNIKLHDEIFQLQGGLIAATGPWQGAGVSSSALLMVQRTPIVLVWAGKMRTKGLYDLGIKLHGKANIFKYELSIVNPTGGVAFDKISLTDAEYTHDDNGIKLMGRISATPIDGLTVAGFGGYAQYKTSEMRDTNNVAQAYGIDLVYDANNINIQSAYISGAYDQVNYTSEVSGSIPYKENKYYEGFFLQCGYKIDKYMPTFGFDYNGTYKNKLGPGTTCYIVGLNAFFSGNIKCQINYVFRKEAELNFGENAPKELKNDIILFNLQYSINYKNIK
jgi:hypothetical protein